MAQQTINTVIVLRNDQTTNWESSDYVMLPGEVGIGYLANGNVIAKLGDGAGSWKDLPQIEGVFEDEITLTHNFGRYKTSNGFVKTDDAKGKTISQWLVHALSETKEPTVTPPSIKVDSATFTPASGEVGTKITKINWTSTFTDGQYEYGSSENPTANSNANTSISAWEVKTGDNVLGTLEDGNADYAGTMGDTAISAVVSVTATINTDNAYTPLNNVGAATDGKITGFDENGIKTTTATKTATVTGYRKPFWGVLTPDTAIDTTALTSDIVRGLPQSGTSTKGLPSSIDVAAGSQMVIFAAKAGSYSSLTATDDKAMNATVSFEKVTKAVKVEGANNYEAVDYDIWYVNWGAGIGAAKKLTLKWA